MKPHALWLALVVALSSPLARADIKSEVPAYAQDELAAGQVVVKSEDVPGAPWPRLILYQVVDAPPQVLIDLLNDYDAAPSYTPNLISAKVLTTNPDGSKDIEYTVKVPILQKISYTVHNTYKRKGNSYSVDWNLIRSPLAKTSTGSIRIEPYGKDKTLLSYTNFVVPITNLVAGLKGDALKSAKETVSAIKAEAERRGGS